MTPHVYTCPWYRPTAIQQPHTLRELPSPRIRLLEPLHLSLYSFSRLCVKKFPSCFFHIYPPSPQTAWQKRPCPSLLPIKTPHRYLALSKLRPAKKQPYSWPRAFLCPNVDLADNGSLPLNFSRRNWREREISERLCQELLLGPP